MVEIAGMPWRQAGTPFELKMAAPDTIAVDER